MDIRIKVIFTVFVVIVGTAICFIDPKKNNLGPDWLWRGGKRDPLRNAIGRPDGTLRKYTKPRASFFGLPFSLY